MLMTVVMIALLLFNVR